MNKQERKERNQELRKNAPIPDGEHDITNVIFENIHNGITMTIVSHWVGDMGVILWTSDAGDIYSTRDIKAHWIMLEEEPEGW
tara:strand:- start:234 stop:482 length:249 start_codon:yes stop_codon:yes gene_type:complete